MELKEKLKIHINELIQGNINRHYQYIGEQGITMNDFNRKFIPTLLKEINKDIDSLIDVIFEEDYERRNRSRKASDKSPN